MANETNNGKKGGVLKGKSHVQGGIKAIVTDTNKPVELEADEVIITKPAVKDQKVRTLKGTNKQILNTINQSGGGVPITNTGAIILEKGGSVSAEQSVNAMSNCNYEIVMEAYDGTSIVCYCTTDLQRQHIIEMFIDIKENKRLKYKITYRELSERKEDKVEINIGDDFRAINNENLTIEIVEKTGEDRYKVKSWYFQSHSYTLYNGSYIKKYFKKI